MQVKAMELSVAAFVKGLLPAYFASQSAFVAYIVFSPVVFPPHLQDSMPLRALLVFLGFGLVFHTVT